MIGDTGSSPFVEIGRVLREQGLKGELKVQFNFEDAEQLEAINLMYLRNQRGDFYPCRIADFRIEGKGNKTSFFVQFDHIADRSSAAALKNRAVFIERSLHEQLFTEEEQSEPFIDYEVVDEDGKHVGLVTEVLDSGLQQVLTVASPKGALLIPVVDAFVCSVDDEQQIVYAQSLDILRDM
jgi:16S rRNA processing protein RimM